MASNIQPRLMLDTTNVIYEVSEDPEPKFDLKGEQKFDRETGQPMWTVKLYGRGRAGRKWSAVFDVTVVSAERPDAIEGQKVVPTDLEALPWSNEREGKTRTGVAFRASGLEIVETGRLSAVA